MDDLGRLLKRKRCAVLCLRSYASLAAWKLIQWEEEYAVHDPTARFDVSNALCAVVRSILSMCHVAERLRCHTCNLLGSGRASKRRIFVGSTFRNGA